MLALSPLSSVKNETESEMLLRFSMDDEDEAEAEAEAERAFADDFIGGGDNLLEAIDFDDLLLGNDLPDLEIDRDDFFSEFSASESDLKFEVNHSRSGDEETAADSLSDVALQSPAPIQDPESEPKSVAKSPSSKEAHRRSKKSSAHSKSPPGKKKAKVDWTPELHRRFVQAVEQLGIDKAVPSKILEIMGSHCLTRHNIASHLQKYRSHRKHVQAREAEAASWARRRHMYGGAVARREANPWIAPSTIAFPPVTPLPPPPAAAFRPLHVWGHPSVDQSLIYTWPSKYPTPPHTWPPPADPSFWHSHHQYVPPPGTVFFPPPQFPLTRFTPPPAAQTLPQPPSDVHPSKESIDAAIGDVLATPGLPLPLGLKPPSLEVVMVQLRRQGVSKVPPT